MPGDPISRAFSLLNKGILQKHRGDSHRAVETLEGVVAEIRALGARGMLNSYLGACATLAKALAAIDARADAIERRLGGDAGRSAQG